MKHPCSTTKNISSCIIRRNCSLVSSVSTLLMLNLLWIKEQTEMEETSDIRLSNGRFVFTYEALNIKCQGRCQQILAVIPIIQCVFIWCHQSLKSVALTRTNEQKKKHPRVCFSWLKHVWRESGRSRRVQLYLDGVLSLARCCCHLGFVIRSSVCHFLCTEVISYQWTYLTPEIHLGKDSECTV